MIFFKFPFNDTIFTTDNSKGEKHISFFPFDDGDIVDFEGHLLEINPNEIPTITSHILAENHSNFPQQGKEEYLQKISEVIDFIKENQLKKLVISRQKIIHLNNEFSTEHINLTQTFFNLCKTYPNAFTYFFIKNQQCWMGAFSEVLGEFNKENSTFHTMSLAGTLPTDEVWGQKEIEEQKPVTEYIFNILKRYTKDVQQSETYDHISGNIKHLRTDFQTIINPNDLEKIIIELHPTPAVCGIPKAFCREAIIRFEPHHRELYSGYIKVNTDQNIRYFVNLRCAKFYKNAANIFVGGGITKESHPEKEWQETELKSEAILKNIAIS